MLQMSGLAGVLCILAAQAGPAEGYEPTWESLDRRPTAAWFDEAKFGIFIHWGVYSVPAWAPTHTETLVWEYAEWYPHWMKDPEHPTYQFHRKHYGDDFSYAEFAPQFKAELWSAQDWAELFERAGAKYVVTTAKHADGYCLWPSKHSGKWNSMDLGPNRDLIGQWSAALRERGLKVGLYYCLFEWDHPDYPDHLDDYMVKYVHPQMKDLVARYRPDLLWSDGEWQHSSDALHSKDFLVWLFNESPVRETIVINDRWGQETRSHHGGYFTTEYGGFHGIEDMSRVKWEECRGLGRSFGYNRNERVADYMSAEQCVHLLVDTVARGGNLLLDIGPRADGTIPPIMEERLLEMGRWLEVNGEAIYATRPYGPMSADEGGVPVRYTRKGDVVYAICLSRPTDELRLSSVEVADDCRVTLLGSDRPLKSRRLEKGLAIESPDLSPEQWPCRHAYVFKIRGIQP